MSQKCPACNSENADSVLRCIFCGENVTLPLQKKYEVTAQKPLQVTDYIKDLKNWAKWIIFWSVINFALSALIWTIVKESGGTYYLKNPTFFHLSMGLDIVAFLTGIVCFFSKIPWPGFFVVFSAYLISVGISNLFYGSGLGPLLGIIQIGAGLWSISKAWDYHSARKKAANLRGETV